MQKPSTRRLAPAILVIIIFGIISMLGDVIYEGARSANGQYLNLLGFSAASVGLVFGLGEFLGYALRLVAGLLSDKTGRHWLFIFLGYSMLIVVAMLGITNSWPFIVTLILLERLGKALRNPAKDTLVSQVAEGQVGVGFAFGLQEALDQIGAFLGPLIFTLVFLVTGKQAIQDYQLAYRWLVVPFVLLMAFLYFAMRKVKSENLIPKPKTRAFEAEKLKPIFTLVFLVTGKQAIQDYQLAYRWLVVPFVLLMAFLYFAMRKVKSENLIPKPKTRAFEAEKLKPIFWIYTAFTFFSTLGFVNFSLIGYHLKDNALLPDGQITLLYAVAMAVDALAALVVGRWYDRLKQKRGTRMGGLAVLAGIPLLTLLLPFLTLSHSVPLIVTGMLLFGIVIGTHETIMRSAIADLTPFHKRGTGYGVFNSVYGLAFLAGAALMGKFYDLSWMGAIYGVSVAVEALAIVFYLRLRAMSRLQSPPMGEPGNSQP